MAFILLSLSMALSSLVGLFAGCWWMYKVTMKCFTTVLHDASVQLWFQCTLVMSGYGNIFILWALCEGNPLVTHQIPLQRASNAVLWCFLHCYLEQAFEQIVNYLVIVLKCLNSWSCDITVPKIDCFIAVCCHWSWSHCKKHLLYICCFVITYPMK